MTVKALLANEVADMTVNKKPLFILDVRNESDYNDWKIEGEAVTSINIPYFDLIDGVDGILDQLPKDQPILVVCAKEGSSVFVAESLAEAGLEQVSYLSGGMKSWSEYLYQAKVYQDEDLKVYQFIRVGKGCLSYMVVSGEEALIVDPSRFIDVYEKVAFNEGVKITHIVDSHLHADHISGGRELAERLGAQYYLMKSEGAVFSFNALEDFTNIEFERVSLEVLAVKTPGHTPGSVSFLVNNKLLFSGDTIFVGGLGRPDLGGKVAEWAEDLYETVYEKVAAIADDVVVLPGHYANLDDEMNSEGFVGETLGNIRSRNDMMRNKAKEDFVEMVVANANSETPPNFEDIVGINRGVIIASAEKQQELEIGPNRCALHHTH
ncbi:glyoxylase-like metal-dependent hydrolase (beta-lactamase superfamily II) [Bacillus sp. SLBN-46]|uniref:MBL fold metallo-hydrolase n=1 Tax=Bacillus sp. SLBN-46 TaxID=3042283 RepID=UPI0028583D4A|nr:MBL fold metallo-hydrolase [Bacillus sp. SLBN-46]MDR6123193.1 glyoxylase-like metal-dependent hydrolase (beta-lactamase superfamily II) [Bacillus sp. SLBN-46]